MTVKSEDGLCRCPMCSALMTVVFLAALDGMTEEDMASITREDVMKWVDELPDSVSGVLQAQGRILDGTGTDRDVSMVKAAAAECTADWWRGDVAVKTKR